MSPETDSGSACGPLCWRPPSVEHDNIYYCMLFPSEEFILASTPPPTFVLHATLPNTSLFEQACSFFMYIDNVAYLEDLTK